MDQPIDDIPVLSIRQPWVDLILRGRKTIEVREWKVSRFGPILIHAAKALDWRSIELFGYDEPLKLSRGGIVGYAEISEVFPLTRSKWDETVDRHLVLHQRRPVQFGAVLTNVRDFGRVVRCGGSRRFFEVPSKAMGRVEEILRGYGLPESEATDRTLPGNIDDK